MPIMEAQKFIDLINSTICHSFAVARFDKVLQRDLLIVTTRLTPSIQIIHRKAFDLLPDGTVFFDNTPLEGGSWLLNADLIVKHEKKIYFDSSISNDATLLFNLVAANIEPEFIRYFKETDNEIKVAQTLLPLKESLEA